MDKLRAKKILMDAGVAIIAFQTIIALGDLTGSYLQGKPINPWCFTAAIFLPLGLVFVWLARRFDKY